MGQLHYISGAAGTGKTFRLADAMLEWLASHALAEHQTILALTRMHGSRKRLRERLGPTSAGAKLSVSTVDSFALHLVNRWRLSLGYSSPILPGEDGGFTKDELGYQATFDEIMEAAAQVSRSPNVAKTIANSFPLILVDEFQDCTGFQLSLIKNLREYVDLVIAADSYQALDGDESACHWIGQIGEHESVRLTSLTEPHRTHCQYLHEAANALREDHPAIYRGARLPLLFAPNYNLAPWKLQPRPLLPNESAALIYPTSRAWSNLTTSTTRQNDSRSAGGRPTIRFPWLQRISDRDLLGQMHAGLADSIEQGNWQGNEKWRRLYEQAVHISRAKGYGEPTARILRYVVSLYIQNGKHLDSGPMRFEATTIHGAKNREFSHVYVFWDDNLCAVYTDDQKRRLLYNAITRARTSCTVVAIGNPQRPSASRVLSLLGGQQ